MLEWYRDSIGDFASFCEANGLDPSPTEIKPFHIRAWIASLQDRRLSEATINNRFRALSSFISWCICEGIINDNPLKNIHTPPVGKTLIPVFTPDHVRAMLYLCPPNTWWGARDRAIILTLFHTGVRLSELCGLMLVDIDLERKDIRINRHTFAVNFLKAGGSLGHLQEIR